MGALTAAALLLMAANLRRTTYPPSPSGGYFLHNGHTVIGSSPTATLMKNG